MCNQGHRLGDMIVVSSRLPLLQSTTSNPPAVGSKIVRGVGDRDRALPNLLREGNPAHQLPQGFSWGSSADLAVGEGSEEHTKRFHTIPGCGPRYA